MSALAAMAVAGALTATPAFAAEQAGRVVSAGASVQGARVLLYQAGDGSSDAMLLGRDRTNAAGTFSISHDAPDGALLYLVSEGGATAFGVKGKPRGPIRFATVLGTNGGPGPVTINEYTTIATAYAFNQFLNGRRIAGVAPGPKNAFAMMGNMVDIETGEMGEVLATAPNGSETQTMGEFNSLANLLATCARSVGPARCDKLFKLATPPGARTPSNTLQAVHNIARNPGHRRGKLFKLSEKVDFYQPTMPGAPKTWTLALRFVGNGMELDGPGNFAFDADGNAWVGNNYVYTESPFDTACGGQQLLRFDPSGKDYPGAPYEGGGLYGVGYGTIIDRDNKVWVSNFGFQGKGCEEKQRDRSLSKFNLDGEPLSPDRKGFTNGDILRPQGMASDQAGNVWTASCGNDSLVVYPGGEPSLAENYSDIGIRKPFDVTTDSAGNVWTAGNRNNRIAKLDSDGNLLFLSERRAGGLKRPMGVVADAEGNVWVANSGAVVIPCYVGESLNAPNKADASVIMFGPDGSVKGSFTGGGVVVPWGISLDGDNNVWVSNFGGQRLSHFCGPNPDTCPAGKTTGDPISPKSGYAFDGLTRNTVAQVDPSGNVWVTNNWLLEPIQTNPGGKQIVIFVGMGAPTKAPVIGPPQRP
ncbi:NHL repeat-containing protein [Microbaculum marinum]|uniref:NHL repeat-containing protein n=1 Tax=Microbaculum marinum TaxID=1764581 RepID=A0AAW9RSG8_9HYPH